MNSRIEKDEQREEFKQFEKAFRRLSPKDFSESLLEWYDKNKRELPWRKKASAYHIWISEIMLQQTRVEAVIPYYLKFIQYIPDIQSLAEVDDEVLHKLWEGLGYYSRAKNLKKAAKVIRDEFALNMPSSYETLLTLPGIGPYTAGAIASLAFLKRVPAVDGNVMRVLSRIFGFHEDISKQATRKKIENFLTFCIPENGVERFNQGLMELGALVCIPNGEPKCEICPFQSSCYAEAEDKTQELPVKKTKKSRKTVSRSIFLFVNQRGEFLLRKREKSGLLADLWEFPGVDRFFSEKEILQYFKEEGISFLRLQKIETAKHIFTHIEWRMEGYLILLDTDLSRNIRFEGAESVWLKYEIIRKKYGIPSAFRAFLHSIEHGIAREELETEEWRGESRIK